MHAFKIKERAIVANAMWFLILYILFTGIKLSALGFNFLSATNNLLF